MDPNVLAALQAMQDQAALESAIASVKLDHDPRYQTVTVEPDGNDVDTAEAQKVVDALVGTERQRVVSDAWTVFDRLYIDLEDGESFEIPMENGQPQLWTNSLGENVDLTDIDRNYALNILHMVLNRRGYGGDIRIQTLLQTVRHGREPNREDELRGQIYDARNELVGLPYRAHQR